MTLYPSWLCPEIAPVIGARLVRRNVLEADAKPYVPAEKRYEATELARAKERRYQRARRASLVAAGKTTKGKRRSWA
jgi:hypothetical protein